MSDQRINLAELRDHAERLLLDTLVSPGELLALVEAVEADYALEFGFSLEPAEHREAIARHNAALARFDFGERP